ncbi:Amicyanin precursor [compost metagenome]
MPDHSPRLALTFMLILGAAGCAAGPAPIPIKAAPLASSPLKSIVTPDDTLRSVLAALDPTPSALRQNVALPFTGGLDHPVVTIKDGRYHPYYTHVRMGGTVTWINQERTTQSVTSPVPGAVTRQGDWGGVLAPGERYTMTFNRAVGTFTYYSTFNPDQHGNIIVVGTQK